ncbi:MAG: hypothetical protein WD073_04640 [Xanthobacteraceae bacterium]
MKVRLQIHKGGIAIYEGFYTVSDAESFGKACADAWTQLREMHMARATSVGALYEALDEQLLDKLLGAEISFSKA